MKRTFQIEMNEAAERYLYLKADGTVTYVPSEALEFGSFDECEKYRKEHDEGNKFHTQAMLSE